MKQNKQILLTWDAYNNGFVVTARTVFLMFKEQNILIDEIVYLQDKSLQASNLAEIDVFLKRTPISEAISKFKDDDKIKTRLRDCLSITEDLPKTPKYDNKNINIKGVTHYQSIYDALAIFIKQHFGEREDVDLHINVSPGTPHMHVVWLMLNSGGFLPKNTTLWSSQWVPEKQKTELNKITFKPKTFLSRFLKTKYLSNNPVEINPAETKSQLRQEAEDRIEIFSHIPNAPILLLGERGTGKSTYAKELITKHQGKVMPYKELACGTFSEELMRSELFGYVKGAFTGADSDKKGILASFEKNGILFLDEIHDLSKPLQRQLMQVLQSGDYYPIGSAKSQKANFRLITASNKTYEELANYKLDADFLDRVARFVVEIPPLRHSRDDIKNYWEKVWSDVANFENAPKIIWNKELEQFLNTDTLPGNFRDLQKIASYIIAYSMDNNLKSNAVSRGIAEYQKWRSKADSPMEKSYFKRNKTYDEVIAEFNRDFAKWAIAEYGSKHEASEKIGRSVSMLTKDLNMNRLKKKK